MAEMVLIDDTDSSITYSGGWSTETGNLDTIGTFGPPFLSTVHGTQGKASLTVSFSGTKFNIIGSVQDDRTSDSGSTTQWQCIVDGSSISPENPTQVGNRQSLCGETLSDGPHQVVVQAVGTSQKTFWFDFLQYIPSAGASLTDSTTLVQFTSSQIQHTGSGWMTVINNSGILTNSPSNSVRYTFEGFKLIWYGLYDSSFPSGESTAMYSIDGGPSTAFTINSAKANGSMFNQIIFLIDGISPGTHTLEVVYTGNSSVTPLSVQAIARFGQAASVSSSSSTATSPTPPTLSSSISPSSSSGSSTPSTSSPQSLSFFSISLPPSGVSAGPTSIPSSTSTLTKFPTTSKAPQSSGLGMPRSSTLKTSISAPGSTSSASPQHDSSSVPKISAIVAPVLVSLLLLIIISLVCLRRRRLRIMTKSACPFPFFSRFTNVNATPKHVPTDTEASPNRSERADFHEAVQKYSGILVIGHTSQAYHPSLPQEQEGPSLQVQVEDTPPPAYVTI